MHSHKCRLAGLSLLLCALLPSALHAQSQAQPPDLVLKSATPSALSDADRAKRDADKVSQWIRLVADKAAAKPAPAPAAVAAAAAKKAGPAPVTPSNNSATLAAARKQIEASTETGATAAEPAPAPVAADTGTRMAMATLAAPAPASVTPPPAAIEEPEVPLKPLFQVQPEFPRQLVNTLQSGMVAVRFTVRPDGTVSQAEAISSSHRRLSQAAIDAVKQWRFAPIKQERTAAVEVGFKLE
nr:energy transducer TonB [uncultured Roseateles sp.]